ncbi:hypothetical protein ACQJBY_072114 [Aegilops geniculata]
MSVMLSILSSFLLVMVAGGGLRTSLVSAEETIVSNSGRVIAYWQTMLPNTPMPSAIQDLLTPTAGNDDHITKPATNSISTTEKGTHEKFTGVPFHKARKLRPHIKKFQNLVMKTEDQKFLYIYGTTTKTDNQKFPYIYNGAKKIDDQKFPYIYGPATKTKDHKFPYIYDPATKPEDMKFPYIYGPSMKPNDQKFPYFYGPSTKTDDQNFPYIYGPDTKTNDQKFPYIYGPTTKPKNRKSPYIYGPTADDQKFPYIYGSAMKPDNHKFPYIYGPTMKTENGHEGDVHIHGDFTFTEDIVKLGSTIIPYILPSATLGAPLLQRDIADYIPISIRNFNGIMKMFAPVSYSMANDIWSTLNMCEHVRPLKGEKKMCIGSVESMVEFVSSVLGSTRDLRAFSSSQVPNEGVVTKRRYKVVASRRPTESSETATCHGMNFPYAVFMCHAMNPTRVYALTLQSENDGGEGQKMEVLVVCHLDTSGFDPSKMPKGTRPGEAPACHFVGRDTVLWAPVAAAATTTAA